MIRQIYRHILTIFSSLQILTLFLKNILRPAGKKKALRILIRKALFFELSRVHQLAETGIVDAL